MVQSMYIYLPMRIHYGNILFEGHAEQQAITFFHYAMTVKKLKATPSEANPR